MESKVALVLLFAGCVLGVFVTTVSAAWEDGDEGIDRAGTSLDLPIMPIPMDASHTQKQCFQHCQNNLECMSWSFCKHGFCLLNNPACFLYSDVGKQKLDSSRISGVKNQGLKAPKFIRIPVGHIKPEGWLKRQLQIQLDGLSGHLQMFWADIMNSSWIGGDADGGLEERYPYWLNGIIPLAYQLNNATLKAHIDEHMGYIISHQTSYGWLGVDNNETESNNYWARFMQLLAMVQYYEATGNKTVITSMFKFLRITHRRMFSEVFVQQSWTGTRWQDFILSIHWLMDNHPSGQEQFLWDIAELVYQQGFSWKDFYVDDGTFPRESVPEKTMPNQGVNNAMSIKAGAVWYRQSHNQSDIESTYTRINLLDKYHGQATGMFSADEHLGGLMPSRGTELCTVVEAMFSYETLFAILGDPYFAERAEQIGYNALPATITPDMWAHQYIQQNNEINAVKSDDHIWNSDGPYATIYGLAPNFGCCTANFNQGWPKMAQSVAMVTPDGNTIAIGIYAPATINYKGALLTITTNYPFDDTVIVSGRCSSPKTVLFRIPSWANGPTLTSNTTVPVTPNTLVPVNCKGAFNVTLKFPMKIRVQRRYKNAASIYRGPLLYGLKIQERFEVLAVYYKNLSKDYEVFPGSIWNYALQLSDDKNPELEMKFVNNGVNYTNGYVFSPTGAPSKILARGRVLEDWGEEHDAAADPPTSPYSFDINNMLPSVEVTLLPYGATNLRIAEIPTYNATYA